MSRECNVSSDCTDPITGTIKVCYEVAAFSNDAFFCDCSPWYGWTGDNCDNATGQNVFYFITLMVLTIWSAFIQIAIARTMYYHFRHGLRRRYDPIVITSLLLFVSTNFYMFHSILTSAAVVDHTRFEIAVYPAFDGSENVEDVTTKGGKGLGYLLLLGGSISSLASLQIFSSWQQIAIEASHFGAERTKLVAASTLYAIRIFIVVFLTFLLIGIFLDQLAVSVVLVTCVSFSLAIGYPIAYFILKKTFRGLKVDGNEYVQRMISTIKFCCMVNAFSLFFTGVFLGIFYPMLLFHEELLTPGKFNYIVFFRDIALLSGLFQSTVMAWYVNTVANRGSTPVQSKGLWKFWDSQHGKLVSTNGSNAL